LEAQRLNPPDFLRGTTWIECLSPQNAGFWSADSAFCTLHLLWNVADSEALLKADQNVVGLDSFSTGTELNLEEALKAVTPKQRENFKFLKPIEAT
jgi:hypothetical protein